jgi:hypothetical protein
MKWRARSWRNNMDAATIKIKIAMLQEHLTALEAWRDQERAAFLQACYEQDHAFAEARKLTAAIEVAEFELEFLKGVS